jgi:hypothetical protein
MFWSLSKHLFIIWDLCQQSQQSARDWLNLLSQCGTKTLRWVFILIFKIVPCQNFRTGHGSVTFRATLWLCFSKWILLLKQREWSSGSRVLDEQSTGIPCALRRLRSRTEVYSISFLLERSPQTFQWAATGWQNEGTTGLLELTQVFHCTQPTGRAAPHI